MFTLSLAVSRQDPVLSLPEGYYLACRCSVPWTRLSVGRVAHLVLEEILLRSTKKRCMKPWYASNMGCFRTCWCKISFIISPCITCSWFSKTPPAQTTLRSTALAFGVYISSAAYWKPYAEDMAAISYLR